MASTPHRIAVEGPGTIDALHDAAERPRATFVLQLERGLHERVGEHLAGLLPVMGIELWRFALPDGDNETQQAWRAVIAHTRVAGRPLIAGAMQDAGRELSRLVVDEAALVDGLALFRYPVHAWDHPKQLHTRHFAAIAVPTLLCITDHGLDAMPFVVEQVVAHMPNATMHVVGRVEPWDWGYFEKGAAVPLIDFINAVCAAVR